MKKIIVALVAALALLGAASPALAQGPAVSADPASVAEAGEHSFTITGSGYSADEGVFVLPCEGAGGDPAGMSEDSCDLTNLTPVTADADGNWTAEVTYNIPAEGLVYVGGNAAQTEVGVGVISVGALADTGADTTNAAMIVVVAMIAGVALLTSGRRLARD